MTPLPAPHPVMQRRVGVPAPGTLPALALPDHFPGLGWYLVTQGSSFAIPMAIATNQPTFASPGVMLAAFDAAISHSSRV